MPIEEYVKNDGISIGYRMCEHAARAGDLAAALHGRARSAPGRCPGVRRLDLRWTELQERWLAPALRGETVIGFALTEPVAGSDSRNIATRATRSAGAGKDGRLMSEEIVSSREGAVLTGRLNRRAGWRRRPAEAPPRAARPDRRAPDAGARRRERHRDGRQWLQYGLFAEVVPDGELAERVAAVAQQLAEKSPLGLRAIKQVMRDSEAVTDRAEALELEWRATEAYKSSHDYAEGIEAFAEKRKPEFLGR